MSESDSDRDEREEIERSPRTPPRSSPRNLRTPPAPQRRMSSSRRLAFDDESESKMLSENHLNSLTLNSSTLSFQKIKLFKKFGWLFISRGREQIDHFEHCIITLLTNFENKIDQLEGLVGRYPGIYDLCLLEMRNDHIDIIALKKAFDENF